MSLFPSGLAGSGSQEEGASLTWTGGHTTGEGEKDSQMEPSTYIGWTCTVGRSLLLFSLLNSHCGD